MKKSVRTLAEQKKLDSVFSVIYKYSHAKFNELLELPEVKLLLKIVLSLDGVEQFVSKYSICKHRAKYEEHIHSLLDD